MVSIALTVAFFASNVYMQRQVAVEQANSTAQSLVRFLAMDVDRTIYGVEQIFTGVKNLLNNSPHSLVPGDQKIHDILASIKQDNDFLYAMVVLDPQGRIIHWSNSNAVPDISKRDFVVAQLHARKSEMFIGKPARSCCKEKAWIFGVSYAVFNEQHQLRYIIAAVLKIDYFLQRYAKLELPLETVVTIVSDDGVMYVRTPGQKKFVGKQFPKVATIINRVAPTGSVITMSPVDGDKLLAGIERVGDWPLFAAVALKHKVFLASWRHHALVMLGYALAVIALLVFFVRKIRAVEKQQYAFSLQLEQQAIRDPLTELYNRRYALSQATIEIKKAQRHDASPLSLMMMDIDNFKQINDKYGHDVGDVVLREVADIMRQQCRASDMLCRYGGEEFFILLPDTAVTGAMTIAEKIRLAIQGHNFSSAGEKFVVTASFGVSDWQDESDIGPTISRADKALYRAKGDGRNCIHCDN